MILNIIRQSKNNISVKEFEINGDIVENESDKETNVSLNNFNEKLNKLVRVNSVYHSVISNLESFEEFEKLKSDCQNKVKEVFGISIEKDFASTLLYNCYDIETINKPQDLYEMQNCNIERYLFFDIIKRCFGVKYKNLEISPVYDKIDYENPITICEVLFVLLNCINTEENTYNYTLNKEDISTIIKTIDNCYDFNITILSDSNNTNLSNFQMSNNFSSFIEVMLSFESVPISLIIPFAEMINAELITEDFIGTDLLNDIFRNITFKELAIILNRFVAVF